MTDPLKRHQIEQALGFALDLAQVSGTMYLNLIERGIPADHARDADTPGEEWKDDPE